MPLLRLTFALALTVINVLIVAPVRAQIPPNQIRSLAWSPDGTHLAVGTIHEAVLYDRENLNTPITLHETILDVGGISAIGWQLGGTGIALARYDGIISLWDIPTQTRLLVLRGAVGAVNGAAWGGANRVATIGDDWRMRLYDALTGNLLADNFKHQARGLGAFWQPGGDRILTIAADNRALLWNGATGEGYTNPQTNIARVYAGAWQTDGERYITGSADGIVRTYQANGAPEGSLRKHTRRILAVGFKDGEAISMDESGLVVVWDGREAEFDLTIALPDGDLPRLAAIRPDGDEIAVVGAANVVYRYALPGGEPLTPLTPLTPLLVPPTAP
ncbi:MAG TPA: hypothetical protein PLD47_11600 [Aggregatilineales bacterium]|nr:hypothetical protein [Anaerolineales bacterium]HRE48359.1 hypothetical protein [Aggregatilineales bacterium]